MANRGLSWCEMLALRLWEDKQCWRLLELLIRWWPFNMQLWRTDSEIQSSLAIFSGDFLEHQQWCTLQQTKPTLKVLTMQKFLAVRKSPSSNDREQMTRSRTAPLQWQFNGSNLATFALRHMPPNPVFVGVSRGNMMRGNKTCNSERKMALWEGLSRVPGELWEAHAVTNPPIQAVLSKVPGHCQRPPQRPQNLSEPLRPVAHVPVAPLGFSELAFAIHCSHPPWRRGSNFTPDLFSLPEAPEGRRVPASLEPCVTSSNKVPWGGSWVFSKHLCQSTLPLRLKLLQHDYFETNVPVM